MTVLFAMLLFGIMAMAALVIDIGLVRLTQRHMRSAVDSAAIEGLRGQGTINYEDRQTNAQEFVDWHFDDDLDVSNGDDGIEGGGGQFGAGPLVGFSGGVGDPALAAGQLLTVDANNTVYKPALQRGDETPGEFRLNIQRGGALDSNANLFDRGPTVPYIFARGSLISRELIVAGVTVSADSTAEARPAVRVGLPVLNSAGDLVFPGAIAVGYLVSDWNSGGLNPVIIDTPKTIIGQTVLQFGPATDVPDGYAAIFDSVLGVDRVIGFGFVSGGLAITTPTTVAAGNAVSRLSDVWNQIDAGARSDVLDRTAVVENGLHVATPKALR